MMNVVDGKASEEIAVGGKRRLFLKFFIRQIANFVGNSL